MTEPYIGEIRMFAGNFAPAQWAFCDGHLIQIQQNEALYSLLGTRYGGDGQSTFAVPEMRGRLPVHYGNGPGLTPRQLGQRYGVETVGLTNNQIPSHNHTVRASTNTPTHTSPSGTVLCDTEPTDFYRAPTEQDRIVDMAPTAISEEGGGQPHYNLMPFLCISFIISLLGIYPPRN